MNLDLTDIKEYTLPFYEDYRGQSIVTYLNEVDGKQFNQDNTAIRYKDVIVGLHGNYVTWKLITCLYGRIYCVFLDNRKESKTYLQHKTVILSHENKKQILLPPGFGNGFLVLSDVCVYNYKFHHENNGMMVKEFILKWNDYGIHWPCSNPILSLRDNKT